MGLFYSIFAKHCFTLQLVNMYLTKELPIITVKRIIKDLPVFISFCQLLIFLQQHQFLIQVLEEVIIANFIKKHNICLCQSI